MKPRPIATSETVRIDYSSYRPYIFIETFTTHDTEPLIKDYQDYRRHTKLGTTKVTGKYQRFRCLNKRPYPGKCELCPKKGYLAYHHWDDTNLSKGIWACPKCRKLIERIDRGIQRIGRDTVASKYLLLRANIERQDKRKARVVETLING